jgi:hypothetical protein
MKKSLKYLVLFAALLGFGAAPAWAQGKSARGRDDSREHSGSKADRGQGGEASADRSNRARRGRDKNDGDKSSSSDRDGSNKRKR